jgi:ABC-type Fe3+ transport system permease subunit
MKKISLSILALALIAMTPAVIWAAGGGATEIIVVADTRVLSEGFSKYLANLYNVNVLLFAVWAAVLTALYGAFLGFLMDFIMSKTGLDLKSRKIVEH